MTNKEAIKILEVAKAEIEWNYPLDYQVALDKAIEALRQEPKTGRWIEFPNHNAYKCSECRRVIIVTDGKNNVCKHYPYCHCGRKMEVDNE